jgi:serine O-acetyltransferase
MNTFQKFPGHLFKTTQTFCHEVPSISKSHHFINETINLLFPIRIDKNISLKNTEAKWEELQRVFKELLIPLKPLLTGSIEDLNNNFFNEIPNIHHRLMKDADAYLKFDPAAKCPEEVILCYPGFYAVSIYRLANVLYRLNIPVLPRVISEYAHAKTGIDIHPGATIGDKVFIDHGTGIVIGETTIIGKSVKLYQGVTLGALYVGKNLAGSKRHPTIEDNVIIYSNSTILGGDTIIGHDSVVGGNTWITESIPPFSVAFHKPSVVIRDSKKFVEPINFVI